MKKDFVKINRADYDQMLYNLLKAKEENKILNKKVANIRVELQKAREEAVEKDANFFYVRDIPAVNIYEAICNPDNISYKDWETEGEEMHKHWMKLTSKEKEQPAVVDEGYQD